MEAMHAQAWIRAQDLSCDCQEATSDLLVAVRQCRVTQYSFAGLALDLCRELQCCMVEASVWHMKGWLRRISGASFTFHLVALAIDVDVTLISGQSVSLKADLTASVQSLAERARRALGVGRGRLSTSSGSVLDGDMQLGAANLQTGDCLTLQVGTMRIVGNTTSFAAILGDGFVVTWGDEDFGGDSTSVQDQLKNVQQIQACRGAYAAILGDGSVVSWGTGYKGGDSSSVQDQLKNVQQIQASRGAFAAILGDGSVVTWGSAYDRGGSCSVQGQLKNVQQIQATRCAFAAILGDGSVGIWGSALFGGGSSSVQDQLKNVQQIQATDLAFAAILADGSVVTWGDAEAGGDSSSVRDQLKNVQQIQASGSAFAAILGDGSAVT